MASPAEQPSAGPQAPQAPPPPLQPQPRQASVTVRVLTVNDVYQVLSGPNQPGGWAGLSSLLKQHRTGNSIFTVNGDVLGGSFRNEISQGRCALAIMNYLKTDIAVLGNHEFDYGDEPLLARIQESKFPWLGSNIRDRAERGPPVSAQTRRMTGGGHRMLTGVQDTWVFEFPVDRPQKSDQQDNEADQKVDGGMCDDDNADNVEDNGDDARYDEHGLPRFIRVGFTGVCTRSTPYTSFPSDDVIFEDPVAHLRRAVRQLRSGPYPCDLVVALTHVAAAEDRRIAGLVPGLDLILGGHDHTAMCWMQSPRAGAADAPVDGELDEEADPDYEMAGHDHHNSNSAPMAAAASDSNKHKECLVMKTGQNATWLGIVDLHVVFTAAAAPAGGEVAPADGNRSPRSRPRFSMDVYPSWRMEHNLGREQDQEVVRIAESFVPQTPSIPDALLPQLSESEKQSLLSGRALVSVSGRGLDLSTKTELVRRSGSFCGQLLADAMLWYWREQLGLLGDPEQARLAKECQCDPSAAVHGEADLSFGAVRAVMGSGVANHLLHQGCCGDPLRPFARSSWDPAVSPVRPALGLINGGFIRGDMQYQAGHALLGWPAVRKELPFSKSTVVVRIRGRHLRRAVWEMLGPQPGQTPVGSTPQLSASGRGKFDPAAVARSRSALADSDADGENIGVGVQADPDADPLADKPEEIDEIVRQGVPELLILGVPIDDSALYDVVTSSFVARGGDGCLSWRRGRILCEDSVPISGILGKYWLRMPVWAYDPEAYGKSEARRAQAAADGVLPVELNYAVERPKELVVHGQVYFAPSDM